MRLALVKSSDVRDFHAAHFQEIGNQGAMTAPPKKFRAHDGGWSDFASEIDKATHTFLKFFHLHVIGVTAKRLVAPSRIARIRSGFAAATEFREMLVTNSTFTQRRGQRLLVELRVSLRARQESNIRNKLDPVFLERRHEIVDLARRVPNRPNSHHMIKRLIIIIAIAVSLLLAFVAVAGWLLTRPVQSAVGNPPRELNAKAVSFESDSGASVRGWWCAAPDDRGVILLLPGIRANRLSMLDRARFLFRAGYSVLLIDFQATGETKGDRITFGWKESRDVLAAVDFIRRSKPEAKIGIVGSSLGGVATLLATPPLQVDAVVLEAVYPTIERATENRLGKYLGPIGKKLSPLLLKQLRLRLSISASQLRPIDHISKVQCPVLLISGTKDSNTTPEDTQLLFSSARTLKQLWLVPNAGHVDLHRAARPEYEARALAFFDHAFN